MQPLPPRMIDAAGLADGTYGLHVVGGKVVDLLPAAEGGGGELGPLNVQYDTVDVTTYSGQSDAGLRLSIPSHVSGDEATHPSVKHFPEGFNGWRYVMGFTPYTGGDNAVEDPCIAVSQDGTHWQTPTGLTNPLDDQAGSSIFNSDTELAVSPDGLTLHCVWRTTTASTETLYVRSTTDGVTWTAKQSILFFGSSSANALSPTIVHDGTQWVMWANNAGANPNVITRRTATAITGPWSAPTNCTVTGLPAGRDLWHLSVIKVGSQFVMLLNDCTSGTNGLDGELYLMRSTDGLAWTTSGAPVISQALAGNYDAVYRGSLVPTFENGRLEFDMWHGAWMSGTTPRWGIYYRRLKLTAATAAGTTGITVQDENGNVATGVTQIDFQGAGVTAAAGTGEVVVAIPGSTGGSGGAGRALLKEVVLSADAATIFFASTDIPTAGYNHLELVVMGRSTQAAATTPVLVAYNSDATDANYSVQLTGINAGVAYNSTSAARNVGFLAGASATAGSAGLSRVLIGDYRGTTFFKTAVGAAGAGMSFAGTVTQTWKNAAAINAIDLTCVSGVNFRAGTVARLYALI